MKIVKKVLLYALYAVFIVVAVARFTGILTFNIVEGQSMEPNYESHDYVIGYNFNQDYSRGDVIIANSPSNKLVIKRIIGLPGDTIYFEQGKLYINGEYYLEDYVSQTYNQSAFSMGELTLNEDEYFIVGDNRDVSLDSRNYGPVKKSDIKAEAGIVIPFSKLFK